MGQAIDVMTSKKPSALTTLADGDIVIESKIKQTSESNVALTNQTSDSASWSYKVKFLGFIEIATLRIKIIYLIDQKGKLIRTKATILDHNSIVAKVDQLNPGHYKAGEFAMGHGTFKISGAADLDFITRSITLYIKARTKPRFVDYWAESV